MVTVTANLVDPSGNILSGKVNFKLVGQQGQFLSQTALEGNSIITNEIDVVVGVDGVLSVQLFPNARIGDGTSRYRVTVPGGQFFFIYIDGLASTVDLFEIASSVPVDVLPPDIYPSLVLLAKLPDGSTTWVATTGAGDMLKAVYDSDDSGVVDDAEKLGGVTPDQYVTLDGEQTLTLKRLDDISNYIGANHIHYPIRNESGATIPKGTVIVGDTTQPGTDYIQVHPRSSADETAIGITHADLQDNGVGLAINTGVCIDMVDTSAWDEGTVLYPNTSGGLTHIKPTTGKYQACAVVTRSHAVQGTLIVEFTEPREVGVVISDITGIMGALAAKNLIIISAADFALIPTPDPQTIYFVI